MNRRELLKMVALATGGVVIGGEFLLTGCKNAASDAGFSLSPEQIALLDEVAETILPTTKTPGAKAAKVGEFMQVMVKDCYELKDQQIFTEGIVKLEEACKKANGKTFMECSAEERTKFLQQLDAERKEYQSKKKQEEPNHYFQMMKQLTLTGYFTSEIGATQALRHVAVPGKYDGCMPYQKEDKAWA
ncbi:MAG: gluconate 2-dehydrogenase subunit 3 family protein [Chitinophagaceae bacterium]|nr:gluconate 2-dehydrogenase subunit 3 family protein [Chitinophagaceae bacterium]